MQTNEKTQSGVDYSAVAKLLQTEESYGTSLFLGVTAVLRDNDMPDGMYGLHPTTVRKELEDILRVKHISQDVMDQLMAATVIAHTNAFFDDLPTFIDVCNILSGTPVSPQVFDPADIYEIAWGLTEAYILDPPDAETKHAEQFDEEILAYIGYMAREAGLMSLPGILKIGQMPQDDSVGGVTNSADLILVSAEADRSRHLEIEDVVRENLGKLLSQLTELWPGYEFNFAARR